MHYFLHRPSPDEGQFDYAEFTHRTVALKDLWHLRWPNHDQTPATELRLPAQ
jgi:hypothetical protein